ncbi:hypothetical protein HOY80DRAFT_985706 [Tuber brumale]|nr:hypothetical protein HOY80DRAFT_985706 [Tuber brumale]
MFPTRALLKRSIWKGPFIVPYPLQDLSNLEPGKKPLAIRTHVRSCTIIPPFVGQRFQVHNGKDYIEFTVTEEMVGHKLGEFAPTRKRFNYKMSKNK